MLGGVLHPAINWADKESHVDDDEMAKVINVNDEYLRKLFEQFGEVIRVAISRKGQRPVGFVHFASRSVADASDPYESALASLPSAAKEILLRILRLGIGTRYDIDIHSVKSLNELPESSAVAVLNKFLISGGDKRNKGDYFDSLIAKHQVEKFGLAHTLHRATYLPRNSEMHVKQYPHEEYDYMAPGRSSRYNSGHHPSSCYIDDPPESQSRIRRSPAEYSAERQQVRFDPFTGEPYKFDPFTGSPSGPNQTTGAQEVYTDWMVEATLNMPDQIMILKQS
ncbi:hypothetical protein HU200_003524 [Digitaria exilis]|uniref:RRM domain-containing protein n=1 Tax=Digitaria exilis TaxID=1010633 RepID=A0A835FTY4_9POAL|nr:hypothetical protein HU200_003524 [Digitaria exilis]